jgi:hypothetical protein
MQFCGEVGHKCEVGRGVIHGKMPDLVRNMHLSHVNTQQTINKTLLRISADSKMSKTM